ncbi:MAG TPA: 50S ribosomal protein L11 methyltransferase [Pyrinomonadaceae bacterium]|jgi:ribosomal protein L11 methyltransferase|nr:50S ribosomal protein L11 methyltransferase [Pyrinomonadaceae bacterium]
MWYALDVTFETSAREAVEYALMEAGALGTETFEERGGLARAVAYFAATPRREEVRAALLDALRVYELESSAVREMELREVADADWLAEWKKGWQPLEVGRRFIIAPPWSEVGESPERIVIRIEPGMAFGTGTHETTRLCLTAIEEHFAGGSFLDVGTGTGILAIAAAKLFPDAAVEACDTDDSTITIAHQNARLNGVAERINFRVGTIDEATASAALVCANLTADVILPMLPALRDASCGILILSGILQTQTASIIARLHEMGVDRYEIRNDGEWSSVTVLM